MIKINKGIIIQGHSKFHKEIKSCFSSEDDIIFSTWENEQSQFSNTIKSKIPNISGRQNSNLQFYSTYTGACFAEQLGWEECLKIRSDIIIPQYKRLLELLDLSVLNFFAWHNHDGGYPVDYIIGGPITKMKNLFFDIESDLNEFPEKRLLNRLKGDKINYILPVLIKNNIECISLKYGIDLTSLCKNDKLFTY